MTIDKELIKQFGLDRLNYKIILVGGTNGKGSTCAYLNNILIAAGYKVGLFTSPHIFEANERIQINNIPIDSLELNQILGQFESTLNYFEKFTLASHLYFKKQSVDIVVCEVGLGGILDPTNLFDPDLSIITSIDYDHMAILGNTIDEIAIQKSGILRSGKVGIIGLKTPPQSLINQAQKINCQLKVLNSEFGFTQHEKNFDIWNKELGNTFSIPIPNLRGFEQITNATIAITALNYLKNVLPIPLQAIKSGIVQTTLIGRFQILPGRPQIVLDVAHNQQAILHLTQNMIKLPPRKHTYAVFGIANDKDINAIMNIVHNKFDSWFIAPIDCERYVDNLQLYDIMKSFGIANVKCCDSIKNATNEALTQANEDDCIICFGSFWVVKDAYAVIKRT